MKNLLAKWLFKEKYQELEATGKRLEQQFTDYVKSEADAKKKFIESFSVKDYIMEKLGGFDPELVKNRKVSMNPRTGETIVDGDIFEAAAKKGIGEDELINNGALIAKNRVFPFIIEWLQSSQILTTFFTAPSAESMNFGRGLTGGVEQVREEINKLMVLHDEKNQNPEEFDKHAAI